MVWGTPKYARRTWYRDVISKKVHLVGVNEKTSNMYIKLHGIEYFKNVCKYYPSKQNIRSINK